MQQQQLETQQAMTNANLNLEENAQRKAILNAMMGTRVFRGSALSRQLRGNTPGTGGENNGPPASAAQRYAAVVTPNTGSLLDTRQAQASGETPAGGVGASGQRAFNGGARGGGSGRGNIP